MSVSVSAPAPVSSPSCWTEQSTVWETQYVDTVTQECRPVTKQECSPVTKVDNHITHNKYQDNNKFKSLFKNTDKPIFKVESLVQGQP